MLGILSPKVKLYKNCINSTKKAVIKQPLLTRYHALLK